MMANLAAECPVGVGVWAKIRTANRTGPMIPHELAVAVVLRNANKPLCLVPCVLFMAVNNLAVVDNWLEETQPDASRTTTTKSNSLLARARSMPGARCRISFPQKHTVRRCVTEAYAVF